MTSSTGIWDVLHSNLDRDTGYTDSSVPLFPSIPPGKFWDSIVITQDRFLSNPLQFIFNPTIRRYMVQLLTTPKKKSQ
jgi:hypothetical protein